MTRPENPDSAFVTFRNLPATLSVPDAARFLGISVRSAYRAVESGEIPSLRIGGRIVIPSHRLLALLDGKEPA